ncbi:MAG TPA: Ppx/GppA family phosphatase [Pseudomonadaceae bacterium]|nr:Ppx/GppA family phosphatase [Pseudomonadaceae bacterium]
MHFDSPYFAALDLGSNSFHMIIARVHEDKVEIIDREKEMIQLARGVNAEGYLRQDAQQRALACLARFAERLRHIPRHHIRAVATKTLRSARQPRQFLKAAEKILGLPIQIISGFEEARLIYSGLAHSATNDHSQRLVVDIGGGSTELVIGVDYEARILESTAMGCVTFTELFKGPSGKLGSSGFEKAYLAACAELEPLRKRYLEEGWQIAYGTSGTVRAIAELAQSRDGGAVISAASLECLSEEVFRDKSILSKVSGPRRSVLPAGLAILRAVFDQFKIQSMHVGDAALKEGLLHDSIGRLSQRDSRNSTVSKLQKQYKVDLAQAQRVRQTALTFWSQIEGPMLPGVSRTKILGWAAQLHEIGLSISPSSHHHHGYYIVRYSDLAGFGRYEQYILANLVRAQRKGLYAGKFDEVDEQTMAALVPLIVCLRLAIVLHRHREDLDQLPTLEYRDETFTLKLRRKWMRAHPLTLGGLKQESDYLEALGVTLRLA